MSTQKPIFLFAFANDKDNSLRLEREATKVREILEAPHLKGSIDIKVLAHASMDQIFRYFNLYHNRIVCFHYGGHSDSQFLHFRDTHAHASGLSTLIGMQEKLELVFLNGCENEDQVKELKEKGVKAIVATSVNISDERAEIFSEQFYQALSLGSQNKKTIQQAFNTAKSYLLAGERGNNVNQRAIVLKFEQHPHEDKFEWDLHLLDDHQANWSIPGPRQQPEESDYTKKVDLSAVENQNFRLLKFAFNASGHLHKKNGILYYHPEFTDLAEGLKQDPKNISKADLKELRKKLFSVLPKSLGWQLNDLFGEPAMKEGRLRLTELNEAYLTLGRLFCAIALSSLWEATLNSHTLQNEERLYIPEKYKKGIEDFLEISDETEARDFDYFWLIRIVNLIFQEPRNSKFKPFVTELASIFKNLEEDKVYYKAYLFMEHSLRKRLIMNDIPSSEVKGLCNLAENHLGLLLQRCAFLSKYQLITVKDVSVNHPRHKKDPLFAHSHFPLTGLFPGDGSKHFESLDRKQVTNNNSIYLTDDFKKDNTHHLNLSPFLIDENVLKTKTDIPKIHFFGGQLHKSNTLFYWHGEDPKNTVLIKKNKHVDEFDVQVVEYLFEYSDGVTSDLKHRQLEILFEQLDLFKETLGIK